MACATHLKADTRWQHLCFKPGTVTAIKWAAWGNHLWRGKTTQGQKNCLKRGFKDWVYKLPLIYLHTASDTNISFCSFIYLWYFKKYYVVYNYIYVNYIYTHARTHTHTHTHIYIFFLSFYGCTWQLMKVPGLGSNRRCSCDLHHSLLQHRVFNLLSHNGNSYNCTFIHIFSYNT